MGTDTGDANRSMAVVYACIMAASLVAFLSFGTRTSLGIFLEPVLQARGWDRETFGLALALQNLVWGLSQPFFSAWADSRGNIRVLCSGALFYVIGLTGMAWADTPTAFYVFGGVFNGLATAAASWTICVGALTRIVPPAMQSWIAGLAITASSLGQIVLATLSQAFIMVIDWQTALLVLAAGTACIAPAAMVLRLARGREVIAASRSSVSETLALAAGNRSFWLIVMGFTICGLHAGFGFTHIPSYIVSIGLPPEAGAMAMGALGITNLFASYTSGALGQTRSKRKMLIWIYAFRAITMLAFVLLALDQPLALGLMAVLGIFWMSSIPPTAGLLGQIFGPYYIGTLLGVVSCGHQFGSFVGAWLGGVIYDRTGSYDLMWWLCAALGFIAMVANLPVNERPLEEVAIEKAAKPAAG
jgi:MFS family permease